MCGIIGISAENNVAEEIYESLLMLQHRGQDAAGMVVCEPSGKLNSRKSKGYVRDVFQQNHMSNLQNLILGGPGAPTMHALPSGRCPLELFSSTLASMYYLSLIHI